MLLLKVVLIVGSGSKFIGQLSGKIYWIIGINPRSFNFFLKFHNNLLEDVYGSYLRMCLSSG